MAKHDRPKRYVEKLDADTHRLLVDISRRSGKPQQQILQETSIVTSSPRECV